MFENRILTVTTMAVIVLAGTALSPTLAASDPVGTTFTYQGQLHEADKPASGSVDLTFRLYDELSGGDQIGPELTADGFLVGDDGLFTINLDFGDVFANEARWLEVDVNGGTLDPRQPITATPVAQVSLKPWRIDGSAIYFTDGYVGIGTSSPNAPLHVEGSVIAGDSANQAIGDHSFVSGGTPSSPNTASGGLSFVGGGRDNTASGLRSFVGGGVGNVAGGTRSFAAGNRAMANHDTTFVWADNAPADFASSGTNQFLIRADGGVGIGTNSPSNQLSVSGGANFMNGDVGIGTAAPRQQLSIGSHLDIYSGLNNNPTRPSIRGSSGDNLHLSAAGDGATFINYDGGSGSVRFYDGTGEGGLVMILTSNGNLAIGSGPLSFGLSVDSTAAKPGGGSWSSFSDARLKRDIEPIGYGMLDRLLSLNGYTFEFEEEAIESRLALPGVQIGLLAHEVAEIFPDWIDQDDDGFLFVTERGLTAIMVEALRDLRAEKDAELDELRARNESLEARLSALAETVEQLAHEQNRGVR